MRKQSKYIYVMGGLGNQLFEYAFAKNLNKLEYNVFLITASYARDNVQNYKLNNFFLSIPTATGVASFVSDKRIRLGIKGILSHGVYKAPSSFQYVDVDKLSEYKYYFGYFQNAKYIDRCIDELREEFKYVGTFSDIQLNIIDEICNSNAVGVHIRRGDYLSHTDVFRIINEKYYECAMNYLARELENPRFYVFSNDINWCKKMFKNRSDIYFIDERYRNTDIIDFEIMRKCKHFIIGNSTFSWWASKLAINPNKIMISPKKWFISEQDNIQSKEALLGSYVLL